MWQRKNVHYWLNLFYIAVSVAVVMTFWGYYEYTIDCCLAPTPTILQTQSYNHLQKSKLQIKLIDSNNGQWADQVGVGRHKLNPISCGAKKIKKIKKIKKNNLTWIAPILFSCINFGFARIDWGYQNPNPTNGDQSRLRQAIPV